MGVVVVLSYILVVAVEVFLAQQNYLVSIDDLAVDADSILLIADCLIASFPLHCPMLDYLAEDLTLAQDLASLLVLY